jgi:hypothetical protein
MVSRTLLGKRLLALARTGTAMKQPRIGNRFIVLGRPAPVAEQVAYRELTHRRATAQRLVVIKDGERVGRRPDR